MKHVVIGKDNQIDVTECVLEKDKFYIADNSNVYGSQLLIRITGDKYVWVDITNPWRANSSIYDNIADALLEKITTGYSVKCCDSQDEFLEDYFGINPERYRNLMNIDIAKYRELLQKEKQS